MEGRNQTMSRKHTHSGACLRVERTFMTQEYGSTSRRDAITPFSVSSAIVGPDSSQGT